MYSLLKKPSEYIYFYKSKKLTSCTFLLVFEIVESLQCMLKHNVKQHKDTLTENDFIFIKKEL